MLQEQHRVPLKKTNPLTLPRKIIDVYSMKAMIHRKILCGHNAGLFNYKCHIYVCVCVCVCVCVVFPLCFKELKNYL